MKSREIQDKQIDIQEGDSWDADEYLQEIAIGVFEIAYQMAVANEMAGRVQDKTRDRKGRDN